MKKLLIAAGFVAAATSAALAQGYVYGTPYGYRSYSYAPVPGVYDYAPGYGLYDYAPGYAGDWYEYDRVDAPGRGNSAESQR